MSEAVDQRAISRLYPDFIPDAPTERALFAAAFGAPKFIHLTRAG